MKCVFLLASAYGFECLKRVMVDGYVEVVGIITTHKRFKLVYGKGKEKIMRNLVYDDIYHMAKDNGIFVYEISRMNSVETISAISALTPDILVVSGWYHLIGKSILDIPRLGVLALHASYLPYYRGGAPLVWQIINDEKYAGISLFYMDEGVDSGDIVEQERILINEDDDISSLYSRVGSIGIKMLADSLEKISNGIVIRKKQPIIDDMDVYPQREPADGHINWTASSRQIFNFVRAQTHPYPGAFSYIGHTKIYVWKCSIVNDVVQNVLPGTVIDIEQETFWVSCGEKGLIKILDYSIENDDRKMTVINKGTVLN